MDGRDAIVTSGANLSSFYIQHRNIGAPAPPTSAGLHGGHHGAHPSFHHLEPGAGFSFQSPQLSGSHSQMVPGFQVETSPAVSQHNSGGSKGPGGSGQEEQVKKKRGRPRKYKPDGTVTTLGLSPSAATPPSSSSGMVNMADVSGSALVPCSGGSGPSEKRARGRPPGSGKMQQLASLGKWLLGSVGTGFTPHVIIIQSGEDIAARIMSFSQQGPRAVCIISASGAVSKASLLQPESSGGVVMFEGRLEILCLSGSYLVIDDGSSRTRTGGLCIALCGADHRVIGGSVGGELIADGNVQVIVGSFMYAGSKKNKVKAEEESGDGDGSELNGGNQDHMATPGNQDQMDTPGNQEHMDTPANHDHMDTPGSQDMSSLSPMAGAWPGLMRPMDSRSSNIDINSSRE